MWSGVTGVTLNINIRRTIDLALRLHPDTHTIAVVTGTSKFEQYWFGLTHAELLRREGTSREVDLVGIPATELLEQVAKLPRQTVVLFDEFPVESAQPAVGPHELASEIAQRFPTYCILLSACLDHGGVGGADFDPNEQMLLAAGLAKRVLSGEAPESIPVIHDTTERIEVDWRQLHHWNISESALPPGAMILYRPPSFWEQYRKPGIAAIIVIIGQFLWIAVLLWQRARKRKAEAALRESEKRFRVMADTTPSLVWMCDKDGRITYQNSRRAEFTGLDRNAGAWQEYLHPDDRQDVLLLLSEALKSPASFSMQYRLRRLDGEYRWMFDVVSPRVNGDGSFAGFIGSAVDITDQKIAQDALENVSGRLIEAQEKERSRIARDLHDDICQQLAVLSMELEDANRTMNGSSEATNERLEEIQQHCAEIAGDVQALSHQLHSSKLDYLGIAAGIRGFCREFAKQHKVSVEFKDENVPTHLPKNISLCLFRVAQEGLHNAVKYSGTTEFEVTLRKTETEVQLEVRDGGSGFDIEAAKRNRGLGLVSMQERVHLLHGTFFVESAPGRGTRIVATVPVAEAAEESAAMAGDEPANISGAA
jgi:PAS domain S-box-containing protein